jgi:hypothetical protein
MIVYPFSGMLPKYIDQNISKYIPMFYEGDLGLGEANILENLNLLCSAATLPDPAFNMDDIFWSIYFGRKLHFPPRKICVYICTAYV